ncbi:alpha/beta fold hydrolase [Arthrobacter sp. STN4]|uniref:alpha/beta hydrolase family protein n=1 Tax=Arthrobacter sp. STN4 TaxID=2923276 RepID=UPI00211A5F4F|nr:alpha/beta fold hydrolase [Arthrobacter sp. STN4]MCQ9165762.1 alpha/beta fold hydrolase [Arthrobacter sp. STN4]
MDVTFTCADGRVLAGQLFAVPAGVARRGTVVIASATAVKASYYHRYAAYLAENGYAALTFDYRGIGGSRGGSLRGQHVRWFEWGSLDIDAVLAWALAQADGLPVHFVGHSFGGFGVGLAGHAAGLGRILTVGAQHAYWRDLRLRHQIGHWGRALLMLPLVGILGYFPAKRLGLMEDLPAGVALDWARSRKDFTTAAAGPVRSALLAHQAAVTAPILALAPSDDSYATTAAMERAVAYTPNSPSTVLHLDPEYYGEPSLGHFALFHGRYRDSFWPQTLAWLDGGAWAGV